MDIPDHSRIGLRMNIYSHVIAAAQREAVSKMDAILGGVAVKVAVNEQKQPVH
jgi:hypothetical protein